MNLKVSLILSLLVRILFIIHPNSMKKAASHSKLVIGLLAVVLLVGAFFASPLGSAAFGRALPFSSPQTSGRGIAQIKDDQRKTDLLQIATALEFYAEAHGGGYPNNGGCAKAKLQNKLADYLSTFPEDPTPNVLTSTLVVGACGTMNGGGYGYIPLNPDSSNDYAEGYLLVAWAQYSNATGDSGVYYNTSAWTPTTTGFNAEAEYILAAATKCTSTTSACDSTVNRYYMIGQ